MQALWSTVGLVLWVGLGLSVRNTTERVMRLTVRRGAV